MHAYQRAAAMANAGQGRSGDEGALGLVEVFLSGLHEPQVRLDVHVEGAVPLLLVAVLLEARQTPVPGPAAVGKQDVEAAEPLDRVPHQSADLLAAPQVRPDGGEARRRRRRRRRVVPGPRRQARQLAQQLVRALGVVAVVDDHTVPVLREEADRGGAESGAARRNQGDRGAGGGCHLGRDCCSR